MVQTVTLKYGSKILTEGTDYEISYLNNIEIGKATMVIEGRGGYTGTVKKTFQIKGMAFNSDKIEIASGFVSKVTYTGDPILQNAVLKDKSTHTTLYEGTDYTVSYKNNIKAGTATVTFTGMGKYGGSFSRTYTIAKAKITKADVVLGVSYTYVKGGAKPNPTITVGGNTLVLKQDYTLSYKNNTSAGSKATVTVTGKGNYIGSVTLKFTVTKHTATGLKMTAKDKTVSTKASTISTTIVITDTNGKKLTADKDYKKAAAYTYVSDTVVSGGVTRHAGDPVKKTDIIPAGTQIRATVTLKGNYTGTVSCVFRIVGRQISKAVVKIPTQYYTGKPVYPGYSVLKVKYGTDTLNEWDYEIVSYKNNVKPGIASVTIRGVGEYGGTKTISFRIAKRSMGIAVHFDGNGATSGSMPDKLVYRGTTLPDNEYKRTGYKFLGWSVDPGATEAEYKNKAKIYDRFSNGSIITLYAVWQPK